MSFLPDKQERPPAVEHLRQSIRDSRVGRFVTRRKSLTAAVVALLAVLKLGRAGAFQVAWITKHPDEAIDWFGDHWLVVTACALAVFAVVFVSTRLGINWLSDDGEDKPSTLEVGPAWSARPPGRDATHVPRGGG